MGKSFSAVKEAMDLAAKTITEFFEDEKEEPAVSTTSKLKFAPRCILFADMIMQTDGMHFRKQFIPSAHKPEDNRWIIEIKNNVGLTLGAESYVTEENRNARFNDIKRVLCESF